MLNLSAAGLTENESYIYHSLLSRREWKPADLAREVGETRTNIYKILDKLTSLGLAEKFDKHKKIHYRAANPTRLLALAQEARDERESQEKELELNAQLLLKDFIKIHEQPGVRFFVGKDEIRQVYLDQVAEAQPIYFMLSPKAIDYYGYETMHDFRMLAVKAGNPRYAITPDNLKATRNYKETDGQFLLERTWLRFKDYTAPLEWGVYGNKVYFITFGEDALGIIVESKAMADGMLQTFNLIKTLQRSSANYDRLPRIASIHQK